MNKLQKKVSLQNKACPICSEHYICENDNEADVCELHQEWKVTRCIFCGKFVYTDQLGLCYACYNLRNDDDRRTRLEYGFETIKPDKSHARRKRTAVDLIRGDEV